MERIFVKGNTVGEMEESAMERTAFMENDVMGMVLNGGFMAEGGYHNLTESIINFVLSTTIVEIDYAMGVRERNRKYLVNKYTGIV